MAVVRRKIPTAFTLLPEIAQALDELTEAGAFSSNSEFVAHLIREEWARRWPSRDLPSITTPPHHATLNDSSTSDRQLDSVRKPTGGIKYSRRKT
jgi:Arc/MetJ-type ribon-helix-helix transcriptional regulator